MSQALKLYLWEHCPFCQKAAIVAAEHGIKYERALVPLDMPDWYKKLNPRETVPTLEANGKLVFESNLVARYFDSLAPSDKSLWGTTPRERYEIDFFLSQVGDFIGAGHQLIRDPFNPERRKALRDNAEYMDRIISERQTTGPYILDRFTMADVAVLPFLIRFVPVLNYYAGVDVFAGAPLLKRVWAEGKERPSVKSTTIDTKIYVHHYLSWQPESSPIKAGNAGYLLYGSKICPFVDRARLACAAKQFKPFWVDIDLFNRPAWFNYFNYRETVPVLYTPEGEAIFESQPMVHYIDDIAPGERRLTPTAASAGGDPYVPYTVHIFEEAVSNFVSAHYGLAYGSGSPDEKAELEWAAGEVAKLLEEKHFGQGPFHGGARLNAGDIALLPFLVRAKAAIGVSYDLDIFAKFPALQAHLDAGLETPEGKEVFAPMSAYVDLAKKSKEMKKK